ncbi:MAG TPA: hypothetical protein VFZ53_08120 [Polyangiaceae bacterium]
MSVRRGTALLGSAFVLLSPLANAAEPPGDLQAPENRDRRNTPYALPADTWSFDIGALGIGGGDAFAKLGVAYGFLDGAEVEMNLAHASLGLVNLAGRWHFLDTPYFDLGASLGVWYGHGEWFWIVTGPAKELIRDLDVLYVPIRVAASSPVSGSVQFDLGLQYSHAEVFGTVTSEDALFLDAQLGMRQFELRPGVRFFLSDTTELGVMSNLPVYSAIPIERARESEEGGRNEDFVTVPFSELWSVEASLRSRFAEGVFGSVRLHYGEIARGLYGAPLYPSFDVELRL